jgi:phosphoribosylaminoimidazole (AIR) synthetase
MYSVFNMGIGFCVVVPEAEAARAIEIAAENGVEGFVLGRAVAEPKRTVRLLSVGLEGQGSAFRKLS